MTKGSFIKHTSVTSNFAAMQLICLDLCYISKAKKLLDMLKHTSPTVSKRFRFTVLFPDSILKFAVTLELQTWVTGSNYIGRDSYRYLIWTYSLSYTQKAILILRYVKCLQVRLFFNLGE